MVMFNLMIRKKVNWTVQLTRTVVLYKKVDGVTIDLPFCPTLANAFQVHLKRIGHKIIHLALSLITTGGMLVISSFYLPHQNIFKNYTRKSSSLK